MAGITIGRNISSMCAVRRVAESASGLLSSSERLSSGLRINRASDDAAGLSIASTLKANLRVFEQGIRNINDGVSLLNTAHGALSELSTITLREKELATQSANGVFSNIQRQALDGEAEKLIEEFDRIVSSTTFNGQKLLDGTLNDLRIQFGYGTPGSIAFDIASNLLHESSAGSTGIVSAVSSEGAAQEISVSLPGEGPVRQEVKLTLPAVGGQAYSLQFGAPSAAEIDDQAYLELEKPGAHYVYYFTIGGGDSVSFSSDDVDTDNDSINIGTSYAPGQEVSIYSDGATEFIGGISEGTSYWIIATGGTNYQLAASSSDAESGIAVDLNYPGSGSFTIGPVGAAPGGGQPDLGADPHIYVPISVSYTDSASQVAAALEAEISQQFGTSIDGSTVSINNYYVGNWTYGANGLEPSGTNGSFGEIEPGDYFKVSTPSEEYFVWFTIDDVGDMPSTSGTGVHVNLTSFQTAGDVAQSVWGELSPYFQAWTQGPGGLLLQVDDEYGLASFPENGADQNAVGNFSWTVSVTGADSNYENGYFTFSAPACDSSSYYEGIPIQDYYVWFDIDGNGIDPLGPGQGIRVEITAGMGHVDLGNAASSAISDYITSHGNYVTLGSFSSGEEYSLTIANKCPGVVSAISNTFAPEIGPATTINEAGAAPGIDALDNTINISNHGFLTGDRVRLTTSGTLPSPLLTATDYYVIKTDDDAFKLATSYANAIAGTEIDLTSNGTADFTITTMDERAPALTTSASEIDLTSQSSARNALDILEEQFNRIQLEIGAIGAVQSRLLAALDGLGATKENYHTASSRITDIDIAQESGRYMRSQILQQVGVAVLAQANQGPQIALSLLRI